MRFNKIIKKFNKKNILKKIFIINTIGNIYIFITILIII